MTRTRNVIVATGLLALLLLAWHFPSTWRDFRGPYINTGSRDIGPDPGPYPKK
ncbi:hypothetical protein IMY05_004G0163900 [Salix suchowensis]|nr:hypothetical protein IMY05_004G0163900 [Salix suchowensis]